MQRRPSGSKQSCLDPSGTGAHLEHHPQRMQTDARYFTPSCYWCEHNWREEMSPPCAESSKVRCQFLTRSSMSKHLSWLRTASWLTTEALWTLTREMLQLLFELAATVWELIKVCRIHSLFAPRFSFFVILACFLTCISTGPGTDWLFSLWLNFMLYFYELEHKVSPLRKWTTVTTLFKAVRGQWKIKGGVSPQKWMNFICGTANGLLLWAF